MRREIIKLLASVERLREAILFLAEKLSAKEAPPIQSVKTVLTANPLETILEPSLLLGSDAIGSNVIGGDSKGGRKKPRQAKNDPSNETALMAIFQKFYVEYPKHVGRGAAIRALRGALKIATADQIIKGAKKFAAECKEKSAKFEYIPHPATWLNQQRWLDYPQIFESEQEIRDRIEKLRIGLQRARTHGDSKAAAVISDALANDIKKLDELTQTKCEIATMGKD